MAALPSPYICSSGYMLPLWKLDALRCRVIRIIISNLWWLIMSPPQQASCSIQTSALGVVELARATIDSVVKYIDQARECHPIAL